MGPSRRARDKLLLRIGTDCYYTTGRWLLAEDETRAARIVPRKTGFTTKTQRHVSRIENAELSPSHRTIERIAKSLGVEASRIDPAR